MRAAVGVGVLLVVLGAVPRASSQSSASSKDSASTARAVIRLADEYVRETISTYPEYALPQRLHVASPRRSLGQLGRRLLRAPPET